MKKLLGDQGQASASPALTRFLKQSPCPFANLANIRVCQSWSTPTPTPTRLDRLSRDLLLLDRDLDADLAVLEMRGADALKTPEDYGAHLRTTVLGLRSRDQLRGDPLGDVSEPHWDFEFGQSSYFISVFAPLYRADHSRCSGEPDTAFVLFQPEQGFRRFGISSRRPRRGQLSERIHRGFERRGVDYDLALNRFAPKALRYVKPLHSDEPPVRWWVTPHG